MKKLIAAIALVLFTVACSPVETESAAPTTGVMCQKCACCQKMMGDATMKDKLMNLGKDKKSTGEQCKMGKNGKKCCCQKMIEEEKNDSK